MNIEYEYIKDDRSPSTTIEPRASKLKPRIVARGARQIPGLTAEGYYQMLEYDETPNLKNYKDKIKNAYL
jgi:hypothetical protein